MTDYRYQHQGGCRCGAVQYLWHCHQTLAELSPRACQCEFCQPRDARYLSAPDSRLEVHLSDSRFVYAHVFGTYTADFMHCGRCNDLVYVSCEHDGRLLGLVVQQSLRQSPEDQVQLSAGECDFDQESLDERLARRAANWIPELVVAEAVPEGGE